MSSLDLQTLPALSRDLRHMAGTMGTGEARKLVDLYYQLQDFRIQANNQDTSLVRGDEPHETIRWFFEQFYQLEKDIAKALDTYSNAQPLGEWARQHVGVGPVIAAGLLAHIDVTKTHNPSSIWRFAGLVPDQRYVKGQKRDWNASLKVLAWKLGDSFVKQSSRPNCYYGHLYLRRKEMEYHRNGAVREVVHASGITQIHTNSLGFVEGIWGGTGAAPAVCLDGKWLVGGNCMEAAKSLHRRTVRDKDLKATLMSGKLPEGQLIMRARRYAVKRFLLHYYQAAYILHYGTPAPEAYVFTQLGHVDIDPCPIPFPSPSHA